MKTTLRRLTVGGLLATCFLLPILTRAETAVQAWVQRYNAAVPDWIEEAPVVATDSSNNVILTGAAITSGGNYDYVTIQYTSEGVPLWTNLYNGPGNGGDYPNAVAVDSSNNVIVTGLSVGSGGSYDYATIKYSSAGLPLWTNRYGGAGAASFDFANAVAVDGSNNVIVTGGAGSFSVYATIKYSGEGVALWTNLYGKGPLGRSAALAMAVDGSNDVIVTGYSTGSARNWDYTTIKYSSAGTPLWTNRYNGPGNTNDCANAVTVDGNNNVFVTGYSASFTNWTSTDYATIKYSSEGTPLWTNRFNGLADGYDEATALAVDSSNNVIVTGYSTNATSGYDYATIKYSDAGAPLWTNWYNGPKNLADMARAVAVDGNDNVVIMGQSVGIGSGYDYATIGYSSAGTPLWTSRYNGPESGNDYARAMAVDGSGNVIVTGHSTGSGGKYDFATVKYSFPLVITGSGLNGEAFEMLVDNVQPGTLVIEACTNLAAWVPIFTNTTPTNMLFFTDPDAAGLPTRFYRAFQFR